MDPKDPPKDEEPKDLPTRASERTVLGVGGPTRDPTLVGVAVDPNAPPVRPREPTILGVGDDAKPAALVVAADSSAAEVGGPAPAPKAEDVVRPPPSAPKSHDAPKKTAAVATKPAPKKVRAAASSDSSVHPAGVPRSGLGWKLFLLLVVGAAGFAAYTERDAILRQIAPEPAPTTTPTAGPIVSATPRAMPSMTASASAMPLEEASAPLAAASPDGAIQDAPALLSAFDASADASAKDGGAAKDAGAPKDAGAAKSPAAPKDAGLAKAAASAKPATPKAAPKPAPPAPQP